MPAKDLYHDAVRHALEKDGWTITHDPLTLPYGRRDTFVDLGARRLIVAEKAHEYIAVEVKSFVGPSAMAELEKALGQFVLYHAIMQTTEPERTLFLAVRRETYETLFQEPIGQLILTKGLIRILVFDSTSEEIVAWTP